MHPHSIKSTKISIQSLDWRYENNRYNKLMIKDIIKLQHPLLSTNNIQKEPSFYWHTIESKSIRCDRPPTINEYERKQFRRRCGLDCELVRAAHSKSCGIRDLSNGELREWVRKQVCFGEPGSQVWKRRGSSLTLPESYSLCWLIILSSIIR